MEVTKNTITSYNLDTGREDLIHEVISFVVPNAEIELYSTGEVRIDGSEPADLKDFKRLVASVALYYGWEYGSDAPEGARFKQATGQRETETLSFRSVEAAILSPGPAMRELGPDCLQIFALGSRSYSRIYGREEILKTCDALAKIWGWMPISNS